MCLIRGTGQLFGVAVAKGARRDVRRTVAGVVPR